MAKLTGLDLALLLLILSAILSSANSSDAYDLSGNITVRWDVISWTPDGYIAQINITNYQKYRTVQTPGWKLGWTWSREQVIWASTGAQLVDQGDCSRFKGSIPSSCAKSPVIVDRTADVPPIERLPGCSRGGVLLSRFQDLERSTAGFQINVGLEGTTNETVRPPRNFTLEAPRGGYTCGPARRVSSPTRFLTEDRRRVTQALVTWQVVCTYSAYLANSVPPCCVSLSSFDHKMEATCPSCACGCPNKPCHRWPSKTRKCSGHMCPLTINWHRVAEGRVRVSMTNFNHKLNFSDWTLLVGHPTLNHLNYVLHANHKLLSPERVVFWGVKDYNQVITTSGTANSTISWAMGFGRNKVGCNGTWSGPSAIYFNGDGCVIPARPYIAG